MITGDERTADLRLRLTVLEKVTAGGCATS